MSLTGKKALLVWCQRATEGYPGVNVANFTSSWHDGLAFCAILHRYRPNLLDFYALDKKDIRGNLQKAFDVAQKVGIPRLLDVEDIADFPVPDALSVITYLSQFYHAFGHMMRPVAQGPPGAPKSSPEPAPEFAQVKLRHHEGKPTAPEPTPAADPVKTTTVTTTSPKVKKSNNSALPDDFNSFDSAQASLQMINKVKQDIEASRAEDGTARPSKTEEKMDITPTTATVNPTSITSPPTLVSTVAAMEVSQSPIVAEESEPNKTKLKKKTSTETNNDLMSVGEPAKPKKTKTTKATSSPPTTTEDDVAGDTSTNLKTKKAKTTVSASPGGDTNIDPVATTKKVKKAKEPPAKDDGMDVVEHAPQTTTTTASSKKTRRTSTAKSANNEDTVATAPTLTSVDAVVADSAVKVHETVSVAAALPISTETMPTETTTTIPATKPVKTGRPPSAVPVPGMSSTLTIDHCAICKKRVYLMERVNANGMIFHKNCFKCGHCATPLTMGTFNKIDELILCTPHFNLVSQIGKDSYLTMKSKRENEIVAPGPVTNAATTAAAAAAVTTTTTAPVRQTEATQEAYVPVSERASALDKKTKGPSPLVATTVAAAELAPVEPSAPLVPASVSTPTTPATPTAAEKSAEEDDVPKHVSDKKSPKSQPHTKKRADKADKVIHIDERPQESDAEMDAAEADRKELLNIEKKQQKLLGRGNKLEESIRTTLESTDEDEAADALLAEWFDLIRQRNELVFLEEEIRLRQEERKLLQLGRSVEKSLRRVLQKSDEAKSVSERQEEEWLVKEWLTNVKKRDELVQMEEDLRIRMEQEERRVKMSKEPSTERLQRSASTTSKTVATSSQAQTHTGCNVM